MLLRILPAFFGFYGGEDFESAGCRGPTSLRTLLPDDHIFRGNILGLAVGSLALDVCGIQRSRYPDDEAGSREFRIKAGLDRDSVGDGSCPNLIHAGQHSDGKFHVRRGTVATVHTL